MRPLQSCLLLMSAGPPRISGWVPDSAPGSRLLLCQAPTRLLCTQARHLPNPGLTATFPSCLPQPLGIWGNWGESVGLRTFHQETKWLASTP